MWTCERQKCAIMEKSRLIEELVEAKQQPFPGGKLPYAEDHV
jgi:hypothetical protein